MGGSACQEVQKFIVKQLRDFDHSSDLSSSQESVLGVFKTLACLVLSDTLAKKFLPKDGPLICFPNVSDTILPTGHRERDFGEN